MKNIKSGDINNGRSEPEAKGQTAILSHPNVKHESS